MQIWNMQEELDVIDVLNALAYEGSCLQNDVLTEALEGGLSSVAYRELVSWLTAELHVLRKTDEKVTPDLDDASEFAMELSALLKELGCPYTALVTGTLSERFVTKQSRLLLLEYLASELMATKMRLHLRPEQQALVISKTETNTARALEQLTRDLGVNQLPAQIAPKAFFDKLNFKVEERVRQLPAGVLSEPLLSTTESLTDAQWQQLEELHNDLDAEYNLRRQMLLTRLDVTVQSFQWSERLRAHAQEIAESYEQKKRELEGLKQGGQNTDIAALLAARADLAIIEKTSSANVRKNTACKIQKHVIGTVPDRGGRANEHAPPPPEMPAWQQQRASGGGRGGFSAGRGRGGGGEGGGGGRGGAGGGGGGRGGRGGGGGQWKQYDGAQPQRPQYQQHQQQQQHYQPQTQYDQRNNQNWLSGSGRVQGSGWTQNAQNNNNNNNNNNERGYGEGYQRGSGGGGGYHRGHSNYNRGGGGGGRR